MEAEGLSSPTVQANGGREVLAKQQGKAHAKNNRVFVEF